MNYYVFQVSDQSKYGKQRAAQEIFDYLVKDRNAWGFGHHTPNRKAIEVGDKVLFYLTGAKNQVFVGSATLKTGTYEDKTDESKDWYLDSETLRIDLEDVNIFSEPKRRHSFKSVGWKPLQGGSSKISEQDYKIIMGFEPDKIETTTDFDEEMEFGLEKYLEDFIVANWDMINFGEEMKLYEDIDGNSGQQYYTKDVGYIDILAQDKDKNFVVIELKKGRENDKVIGQVLRYISWVRENLCKKGQEVRGLIIVGDKDIKLEYALKEISDKVKAKLYKVNFKLEEYK